LLLAQPSQKFPSLLCQWSPYAGLAFHGIDAVRILWLVYFSPDGTSSFPLRKIRTSPPSTDITTLFFSDLALLSFSFFSLIVASFHRASGSILRMVEADTPRVFLTRPVSPLPPTYLSFFSSPFYPEVPERPLRIDYPVPFLTRRLGFLTPPRLGLPP